MLEMSADERKLALSMLRPGERTIAERFLGIRTEPAPASSSQIHQAANGGSSPAEDTPLTAGARAPKVIQATSSMEPDSLPAEAAPKPAGNGTGPPHVEADFVRDRRQVFKSGANSGGISLEERLFFLSPSLHTTTASAHGAVAAAVSSSIAPHEGGASNVYETHASAVTIDTKPSTLHNMHDSHALQPSLEDVQPSVLQAALQRVGDLDVLMGTKEDISGAHAALLPHEGNQTEGELVEGTAAEAGSAKDGTEGAEEDAGETDELSRSLSEMQRVVQETCASSAAQNSSAHETGKEEHAEAHSRADGYNAPGKDGGGPVADAARLSLLQKRALTSLPPRRPIPVPRFRCVLTFDLPSSRNTLNLH